MSVFFAVNEPEIGKEYSLTCSAAGTGQLHPSLLYQWYKDGKELINETSSVLYFDSLTFCDAGNYSCNPSLTEFTLLDRQQFELRFSSMVINYDNYYYLLLHTTDIPCRFMVSTMDRWSQILS